MGITTIVRPRRLTFLVCASVLLAGVVFGVSDASAFYQRSFVEPSFGVFTLPSGVAVDQATGNVLVADGGGAEQVQVFGATGGAPAGGAPASFNGAPATAFKFNKELVGLAVDNACFLSKVSGSACSSLDPSNGDVYVPDVQNNVVDKFALVSGKYEYVCQFTGYGSTGPACLANGASGNTAFQEPLGVAVDSAGDVYVANYASETVYEYNALGEEVQQLVCPSEFRPQYVAVDATGDVFVEKYSGPSSGVGGELIELKRSSLTGTVSSTVRFPGGVTSTGVAFDAATGRFLFDSGTLVQELDAANTTVGGFGAGTLSNVENAGSVAINETSDEAYVVNQTFGGGGQVFRFGPAVLVPDVTTEAFTNVQAESVSLNGTINPDGLAATSKFEYGPTTGYGQSATAVQASGGPNPGSSDDGEGNNPVPVTANLTGLLPNQTYHYRLDGTNANGTNTTQGGDLTFTTQTILPTVNDKPTTVSDITQTGALVTGTVNPENSPTEYRFEYVTQAEYEPGAANPYEHGASTPLVSLAQSFGDEPAGPIHLTELVPGATYHYALVATNQAGTVIGHDGTFTLTPAAPVVQTGSASVLSQTSVTLNGTLDTRGVPASYGFALATSPGQYGPAIIAGSTSGIGAQAVSLTIAGLAPDTTYWYKLVASNGEGEGQGSEASFTTPGYPTVFTAPTAAPLLATPTTGFPTETKQTAAKTRSLTNAQKLKNALNACKRKPKRKRAACEREARRRYGEKAKKRGRK